MTNAPARAVGDVRTFHPRRGRVTSSQSRALTQHGDRLVLPADGGPLHLGDVFGEGRPVVLEIGFGMGEATVAMAAADPETGILAVDVHTPGVGQLLGAVVARGLDNVRVVHGDAVEVVRDRLQPGSLAGVRIFFPDPWPKTRHHKRRLVQQPFVALLASRLAPGGFVHCATDWPDYADQMLAVLAGEPLLDNDFEGFAPRPGDRPLTRFERRGTERGHPVADLVFRRRVAP
jgi:tRNA (guanine-N7-)-methyltransferase